jgi:peptidyl-prolyl cis-trans isomerase D
MLRILRENASSWMLKLLLIAVALTFVLFFGGGSFLRDRKTDYAAKVNGVVIGTKEYGEAYKTMVEQYRNALGPAFSEKMLEGFHLKEKVLENLVSQVLVLQEGKRLGLDVRDEELRKSIESIPAFQNEGRFDSRGYDRYLRLMRMRAEEFEERQREQLLWTKVVNLIRSNAGKVSEAEVMDEYLYENEKINLAFLKVNPAAYRDQVTVNDIDIKEYFGKHQEEFRTPAEVKVQYLAFRPADSEATVSVSSEDVQKWYDSQKERLKLPRQMKVREILIKVDPQAPSSVVEEKKKKAEELLEKAKKAKDFGALAKQVSESPTATRSGDMGWVSKGQLEPAVDAAISSLKPGEMTSVVKGQPGFFICKVEEIREERQRTLEELKDQIVQVIKREKGGGDASRKAEDAFYSLFRSKDLEGYSREKGIPLKTTGFFKEGDDVPELGKNPAFASAAFGLKTGEISSVVSAPPNFYILKLVEKKESKIPSVDDVKEQVRQKVLAVKSEEKARLVADELLKQAQAGKDLKEFGREKGIQADETGFFVRSAGVIPKIGPAQDFMGNLASLSDKSPVPKEALKTQEGIFVIKLAGVEAADPAKFEQVRKDLDQKLRYQKQETFFANWMAQLKGKAKIEVNPEIARN